MRDPCPSPELEDPRVQELVDWMAARMEEHRIPGAAVVVVHGDETFTAAWGRIHQDRDTCVTEDTRFGVGSLTQLFGSMAVLDAVEEGEMALDEPITSYVESGLSVTPSGYGGADNVTLHHLLSFSSGLPQAHIAEAVLGCGATLEDWFAGRELELRYPPGAFASIVATDPMLAGLALQRHTGEPYADAVEGRVFEPLGMETAEIGPPDTSLAPASFGHYRRLAPLAPEALDCEAAAPYQLGWLSARDAVPVLRMLAGLDPGILSDEHMAQLADAGVEDGRYGTFRVGYGFFQFEYDSSLGLGPVLSYRGGVAGFASGMRYYPDQRFGVFFAYNRLFEWEEWRGRVATYDKAAQIFLDPDVECYCRSDETCAVNGRLNCRDPEEVTRPVDEWSGYAGTYEPFEPGDAVRIAVDGESIEIIQAGKSAMAVPVGLDSFTPASGPLQGELLHVVLDDSGTGAWLHRGARQVYSRR